MIALVPAPATVQAKHWQMKEQCDHGHRGFVAKHRIQNLMRSTEMLTQKRWHRVQHYVKCTMTAKQSKRLRKTLNRLRAWRASHKDYLIYSRLPAWTHAWAVNTGACESGNDPTTNTGNGYYGAFQFNLGTWAAAGGQGMPNLQSWHYQATIAIKLMLREGAQHWPNCG